jgi:hypothetical protein
MDSNISLNIELKGIKPLVWRSVTVPAFITLDRLHDVIQIVMGWSDTHSHEFLIGGEKYVCDPEENPSGVCLEESMVRLGTLFRKPGSFEYTYDFGDNWVHSIIVEKTGLQDDPEWGNLFCTGGAGACPPEDVGGIPGFEQFCEAITDRKHPEHKAMKEWYGEDFDRDFFDPDEANLGLLFYVRWSRDRTLPWNE